MLRALRWTVIATMVAFLLAGAATAGPSQASGPRLIAKVPEPFQVGDRVYPAGTLTLRSVTSYHPGATIDELWTGNEFLGFWVADGKRNESRAENDTVVFERNAAGRLVLVGYVLRGERSDVAYRYRETSLGMSQAALPAAAQRDRVFASR